MSREPEILTLLGGILICCNENTEDDFVLADPNIIKEGTVDLNIFKDNTFRGIIPYGPKQREKMGLKGFMKQTYTACFLKHK